MYGSIGMLGGGGGGGIGIFSVHNIKQSSTDDEIC